MSTISAPSAPYELGDFTTDRSVIKLSFLAMFIGAVSAFVAYDLLWLINVFTNLAYFGRFSSVRASPSDVHLTPAHALIPVLGGLIIGLMARYGSEKIRGHGIPEALEAILIGKSNIEPKVAALKPLSSAISIGTGGPFGAEGPIIMTGGAVGSLIAQGIHLSSAERKTLLVAGAAGGMAAVFSTPIAAVLLAVELLLFEWKPRSLIPVAVAATVAAAVRVPLLGAGPIFPVTPHAAPGGEALLFAAIVGLVAGFGSGALTSLVYWAEDLFPKIKVHWMWWPAIGGLIIGLGGLLDPRILGVGYELIHSLLNGQILGMAALGLLVGKALVWSMALGSGTSGGVLAPLLMMGGAIGAALGQFIPVGTPGLWAMVGMSAMMGGTMRAPFTAVLFTFELTHDINALPALLIAGIAAEGVTVLWLKRSILTEKLARRGQHLTREYVVDPFELHTVSEVMLRDVPTIQENVAVSELGKPSFQFAHWFASRRAICIVDASNRLAGIVTQLDLLRAAENPEPLTVTEAGTRELVVVGENEPLSRAVMLMLRHNVSHLPVVSDDDRERLIGFIDRTSVMDTRLKWYDDEHSREIHRPLTGPFPRWRASAPPR